MRIKLVLLTSLIGALIGEGSALVLTRLVNGNWGLSIPDGPFDNRSLNIALVFTPLIVTTIMSGIFVYRHTAHRRKMQADLTVFLVMVFASLFAYLSSWLFTP